LRILVSVRVGVIASTETVEKYGYSQEDVACHVGVHCSTLVQETGPAPYVCLLSRHASPLILT
jgi:hypothetical protein